MPDPGRDLDQGPSTPCPAGPELQTSLALAKPGSPTRRPILAHLSAIDTELARQTVGQLPGSPRA